MSQFQYFANGDRMFVPKGTLEEAQRRVTETLTTLGLETEVYRGERRLCRRPKGDGTFYRLTEPAPHVTNEVYCETVAEHMEWYRDFCALMTKLKKEPLTDGEVMTEADASTFWHGLYDLHVPIERWTSDYFKDRMIEMYEIMRGRGSEGFHIGKRLTEKQAAAVVWLVTEFMHVHKDEHDLEAPLSIARNGRRVQLDYLCSRDDYEHCEQCGPVVNSEACGRQTCPLREDDDE